MEHISLWNYNCQLLVGSTGCVHVHHLDRPNYIFVIMLNGYRLLY
ncbi:hypothetical protein NC652_028218 [Populus alba x Populus x berolinensis]|nr:hypothetical protein NC652_028218 [Populus alba x Populus x berolinensis]